MTTLAIEPYELPSADLGPENPLPVFRGAEDNAPVDLDPSVPEADRKYMGYHTAFHVLPHRMQDGYDRVKKPRVFHAAVLENAHLRATFLPELGGRLVSLVHKPSARELLDRNPVCQPANLALRNAWFSGGIEWNAGGIPGHHYLTCSPVFAARINGRDGEPALRLYEWDRVKCFPWQIDFHLPSDSPFLFAHVRLANPHDHEIAMYWWTNIATPERPDTRVLFPAATAIGFCGGNRLGLVQLPRVLDNDASYSTNVPFAQEMFSRIPDGQRRWVAHLDASGTGFFETSTDRLRGRKMFCWGMNAGGRRWQEYLSVPGQTYLEIQAGLAATQLECLPMPANTVWDWTEAFGLLEAEASKVHSKSWDEAWRSADAAIESALPRARVEEFHRQFSETALQAPETILLRGSAWGELERRRIASKQKADRVPHSFTAVDGPLGPEQQPWLALLEQGALPEGDPSKDPGTAMVQPEWRDLLEDAVRAGRGSHWLAWHHLGIMRLEARDVEGARDAWQRSIDCRPSGWAYRNLAVLHQRAGDARAERECLRRAWEIGPQIAAIAIEYAHVMIAAKDFEALGAFMKSLPEPIRMHERLRLMSAQAALERGDLDEVAALLDHDFATVREGEVSLTDLWFSLHEHRLASAEHVPIDDALKHRVRREFPPPHRIDFRMVQDIE